MSSMEPSSGSLVQSTCPGTSSCSSSDAGKVQVNDDSRVFPFTRFNDTKSAKIKIFCSFAHLSTYDISITFKELRNFPKACEPAMDLCFVPDGTPAPAFPSAHAFPSREDKCSDERIIFASW